MLDAACQWCRKVLWLVCVKDAVPGRMPGAAMDGAVRAATAAGASQPLRPKACASRAPPAWRPLYVAALPPRRPRLSLRSDKPLTGTYDIWQFSVPPANRLREQRTVQCNATADPGQLYNQASKCTQRIEQSLTICDILEERTASNVNQPMSTLS